MAASNTLMNVKKADAAPALERELNVLGSEQRKDTTAPIAAKPTVHTLCAALVSLTAQGDNEVMPTRHRIQIAGDCQNMKSLGRKSAAERLCEGADENCT